MKTTTLERLPRAKVHFIEPMYAGLVQTLPEGRDWLYEVKFDGYRCLAGRDKTAVTLWSRRGNLFTDQFPQIAEACKRLPPETLVDGEIVAIDEKGRVSFRCVRITGALESSVRNRSADAFQPRSVDALSPL
jgi:ATP-dependent DNA ligase